MRTQAWMGYAVIGVVLSLWLPVLDQPAVAQPTAIQPPGPPTTQPAVNPAEAPRMELSPTVMDFGEVWQGEPVKREFTIKNVGTGPLTISDVKSSCGCTVPTKPKTPLPPGESTTFTITYDTLHRKGEANQKVTVVTNDPSQSSADIAVRGKVKGLYKATPQEQIYFQQVRTDSELTQTVKFEIGYNTPVYLKLKENQDFRPFEVNLKEVTPGKVYELTAATKPPLAEQMTRVDVVLETGIERIPEVRVPIQAYVQPDAFVSPLRLRVARQATIKTEQPVTFTCRSDKPLKVTEVKTSHPSITAQIMPPKPPGQDKWISQEIRITLPPGADLPSASTQQVEILTDSAGPRFQKFAVMVHVIEAANQGAGPRMPTTRAGGPTVSTPVAAPTTQPAGPKK